MIVKLETNVIPSMSVPSIYPVKGKGWVSFGKNNLYPQYINELYNKSSINKTCITSKAIGIFGNGLETVDKSLAYVLNRINDDESWNDVFKNIILDYVIYGGFAVQVIWNKAGDKIHSIYHMPFSDIRSGDFEEDNKVQKYYYSSKWSDVRKHKPIMYNTFDPNKAKEFPNQIMYHFDYTPSSRYCPLPSYSGAITCINIDIETSTFHLANLENGLSPSLVINFHEGLPSPEKQREIYKQVASEFSGVENAGRYLMTFSNSKETAPEIVPLESANDDYYLNLDARTKASVLSAHRITSPLLLGIYEGGNGFSSNADEMLNAWALFKTMVINPATKSLLKPMNKLMKYYGYETELIVQPLSIIEVNEDQESVD